MERSKTFTFGEENATPFRLEIRSSGDRREVLTLSHGAEVVRGLSRQTLELLRFLVERSGKDCRRDDILWAISPDSDHNLVDRYVSYLRSAFADHDLRNPKFIQTVEEGYRFLATVEEEGDLGSMESYPKWDPLRFHELLRDLRREPEGDEDIRIVTTGISPTLDVLDIKGLLKRKLRIKILFMNPKNDGLVESRYLLRKDRAPNRCLRELREQIADIEKHANQLRRNGSEPDKAMLEYGLSDAMPCGFVVHTNRWALLGVFLAHTSYSDGPMFEIHAGTEAWDQLYLDWQERWSAATATSSAVAENSRDAMRASRA